VLVVVGHIYLFAMGFGNIGQALVDAVLESIAQSNQLHVTFSVHRLLGGVGASAATTNQSDSDRIAASWMS
jgi:hypothetical protein